MPDYTKNTDAWNNKAPKKSKSKEVPLGNGLADKARKGMKDHNKKIKALENL